MKSLKDYYVLHNGVKIPCVGFGTWQIPEGKQAYDSVRYALDVGYRHVDTASGYGNEKSVGAAIKDSGIPREEIFLTSKLGNRDHGYEDTMKAFEITMENLNTEYLDLYLIHWPNPVKFRHNWQETNSGSWKAFEELYGEGRIKSIGVSNFQIRHLEPLFETAKVIPMVNQIRLCPGEAQDELVEYMKERNILAEAYSPLGTGKIFDVDVMGEIAAKYEKTIAQISLKWSLQMGFLPLPKSTTPERIKENAALFDFNLDGKDVEKIAELKGVCGYSSDPDKTAF